MIQKNPVFDYNRLMNGVRNLFLSLIALVLLGSLLGTAYSASINLTLRDPKKVEQWLTQSKLYDNFVANAITQGQKTVGSVDNKDVASLSDAAIQDAARSTFTQELINSNINTFIESNYAWLEGKTEKPTFIIDLTDAKQTFAQKVGAYVTTYLASLPVCTNAQLAQLQGVDPLNATCRPATVNPQTEGALVTQQIIASNELLDNTVLTAQNINPDSSAQTQPYYEKLAQLPKAYQFGAWVPYIFGVIALLGAVVLVFLSSTKRRGVKRTGIVLAIAGVILVITKFSSTVAFKQLEDRVFNTTGTGPLQQSLTSFSKQVQEAMVAIDFVFGLIFIVIALIVFAALFFTRNRNTPDVPESIINPAPNSRKAEPVAKPATPAPLPPKKPKRPRLIQ